MELQLEHYDLSGDGWLEWGLDEVRGSLYGNVSPRDLEEFMYSPEFYGVVPYYVKAGAMNGEAYTYEFDTKAKEWIRTNSLKFDTSHEAKMEFKLWAKNF